MQKTGKFLLTLLCMTLIAVTLAFSVSAADAPTSEEIIAEYTINPATQAAYTLAEAWAYAEASANDVEVIVYADSTNYTNQLKAINKTNKKTTLQLTGDVTTSSSITIAKNADITIDVSGATLTITNKISMTNTSHLTFRTTTAGGTISKGSTGVVCLTPSATANPEVSFISCKEGEKELSVNATSAIVVLEKGSTAGTAKISFEGGSYTSASSIVKLNSNPTAHPPVVHFSAKGASFALDAEGFIRLDISNTISQNAGAIGVGSCFNFKNCSFGSINTSSKNFFYENTKDGLNGRFFATVTFDTCSFDMVCVNGAKAITYVKEIGADGSTTVYDSNYPYLPAGETATTANNCTYDYRPEAIAAGWTTDRQITFKGKCAFTKSTSTFNENYDGFASENMTGEGEYYNVFYSTGTIITENALVYSLDDFKYFFDLNKNGKRHNVLKLEADIELDGAMSINKTQDLAIDLNGNTLTASASTTSNVYGTLHIFSSKKGGAFVSPCTKGFITLNNNSGTASATPTITFGREKDPIENLTIHSSSTDSDSGLILFSSSFAYESATLTFYNLNLSSTYNLIKLNSNASKDIAPKACITMKGCVISLSSKGLLSYNETQTLDTSTAANNGRFAVGTFLDVEDCIINGGGANLFASKVQAQCTGGPKVSNFQGRFYGTVTFKNTAFNNVSINCADLYSTKENLAQNGVNEEYVVPDDWDVTKQVTFLEGCTFQKTSGLLNEDKNGVLEGLTNVTIAEGAVIACTEVADQRALLQKSDTVELTWELPDADAYTMLYKKNVEILAPELPEGTTVNGNTYSLAWNPTPELATESATYTTRWSGGATLSANYTLDAAIDFNAYVPVSAEITHINGTPVAQLNKKSLAAKQYWMITFADLAPKDAYKSQCVELTVQLDGETTVLVERYISLVGYAKAALKSEASESLKSLVLHTLDYINKAHLYFEEDAESVAQIDELLSNYEFTPYEWTESNVKDLSGSYENVLGAGLDLSQMPGFAIYVRADYEGEVIVNGKAYSDYVDVPVEEGEHAKYVIIVTKAYEMTKDLTVTVGNDSFTFNLDTFIKYNAASAPYAHALYGYAKAAEEYVKTQK